MATNAIEIPASRRAVYDVLMDAKAYAKWVPGPRRVVEVDRSWPLPGSSFVHEEAVGPVTAHDETVVRDVDPRHEVRLRARVRPFGAEADIRIHLDDVPGGTKVTMVEKAVAGPVARFWNPLFEFGLRLRNAIALSTAQSRRSSSRHGVRWLAFTPP